MRPARMLTKILISIIIGIFQAMDQALLKFLPPLSSRSRRGPTLLTDLQDIHVGKVPCSPSALLACRQKCPYFCANQAPVTIESFSLSWPKNCGLSAMATTAFCTVLLVTSAGRCTSSLESIWRVHEIPKTEVAGPFGLVRRRRVKYEKSSVALDHCQHGAGSRH